MSWNTSFPGADTVRFAAINTAGTTSTIVAAETGKRIRVLAYVISTDGGAGNQFGFLSSSTPLTGTLDTTASVPMIVAPFCPVGHFETAIGEALVISQSSADAAQGHLTYCLI